MSHPYLTQKQTEYVTPTYDTHTQAEYVTPICMTHTHTQTQYVTPIYDTNKQNMSQPYMTHTQTEYDIQTHRHTSTLSMPWAATFVSDQKHFRKMKFFYPHHQKMKFLILISGLNCFNLT